MAGFFNPPKRKLRRMLNAGDYPEALEFGKSIESKYAHDPDFMFIMGSAYYMLGDADNSIRYFECVLEINESDTEALLLSARVYAYRGDKEEARRRCRQILEIDAENGDARDLLDSIM